MSGSNFSMNSFGFHGENILRNNVIDMVNSTLKQNSVGFTCRNIMDNNKIKLTIQQSNKVVLL